MIPDQKTVLLHQRHDGVFPSEDAGKNCLSNVSIVSFVSICQAFFFLAAKYAHLYKQRYPMNKFEKQLEKWNKGILRGAQAKLAKTLGVSTATTALWTTGKRSPSKGYVEQMAKLFDMDALDVYKLFDRRSVIYPDPPNVSSARMLHDRHSNEFGYNMQPHSINEEILPDSIILRNTAPGPTRCVCPIYSSSDFGRNRSANGSYTIVLFFNLCKNNYKSCRLQA